jgi:hypothetical protein
MPQPPFDKPDQDFAAGYAILQQEPLPPYELDPHFNDPVICRRIGELIARPMVLGRFKSGGPPQRQAKVRKMRPPTQAAYSS